MPVNILAIYRIAEFDSLCTLYYRRLSLHTYTHNSQKVCLYLLNNGAMVTGGSELTLSASYRMLLNVPIEGVGNLV